MGSFSPTVLIVEDEALVALALEAVLADAGFRVVDTVATGPAALEAYQRCTPDIVVMDIQLKGPLDGCETARRLTESAATKIVFVTAQSDAATKERATATHPAGYLVKPFTPDQLRASLEAALAGPVQGGAGL